ncbi:DUF3500 domain-containing protein [Angustibacter luteus]|uniref:DUF3500 domain-containing protein n=1 Tax=Angustibacter luteus TaxID=658456 RepID=A0ABW1JEG7_9ACTN
MSSFRDFLFPLDHPRLAGLDEFDAYSYPDAIRTNPMVDEALTGWLNLFETSEFGGITTDGSLIPGLFGLEGSDEPPNHAAATAARELLDALPSTLRDRVSHPLDSKVWRAWMNPEFYVNRFGLRLEELEPAHIERVLALLAASLSPAGFEKTRLLMKVNQFLGELVHLPKLLNEFSYNINLFGDPASGQPWGWNLYGHHVCLNTLFIADRQVFTPVFFGAEPVEMDEGEAAGTVLFTDQERLGLELIQALSPEQAEAAILYHQKRDPTMPADRRHPGDELHLGGAFQDNRVIPYEGVAGSRLDASQRARILELVEVFLDYQPEGPRRARVADARRHLDDTWFCWIGGTRLGDAFYYRIQSPVILIEFDHHAGIFLANTEPERFHVHTLVRTPNGNDYGVDLVRQATGDPQRLNGPA